MFKIYKDGVLQEFAIFAQAVGHPIGFIYTALYDELSPLQLRLDGSLYNRNRYTALWSYVQKHPSLIKTEQEWQEIAAQDDGCCRFFSSGDGSTTFRLPKYPDSKILTDKTDYVIQAYGYVSKDGALDLDQFESMINLAIEENNTTLNSNIDTAKSEVLNSVAENYLKLSGGTVTGNVTANKFITNTGIEIY